MASDGLNSSTFANALLKKHLDVPLNRSVGNKKNFERFKHTNYLKNCL